MQISLHALQKLLKMPYNSSSLRAYWIEGKEALLVEQTRDQLIEYAQQSINTRQVEHVNATYDWQKLLANTQNFGLFSEGTLYDLRLETIQKKDLPKIQQLIDSLDEEEFLILSSDKLEKKFTQLKDFKALDAKLGVITHWPLESKAYPKWIDEYSQSKGFTIDHNARLWLASQYEGNLFALKQCLDRLWIFFQSTDESKPLNQSQLEQHSQYEAKFSIFETVDFALNGNRWKALQSLQQLRMQAAEPILLLWAIDQALTTLEKVQEMRAHNSKINWPAFRVFGPRVSLMEAAAKRISQDKIHEAKKWCSFIDAAIKGLHRFDVWMAFDIQLSILASQCHLYESMSKTTLDVFYEN